MLTPHRLFLPFVAAAAVGATTAATVGPAVSSAAGPRSSPTLSMFTTPLPVPPEIDMRGGGQFGVDEVVGTHRFATLSGTTAAFGPTPSFGYWPSTIPLSAAYSLLGGPYLGATVQAMRDVPIHMTVTNKLVERGDDPRAPAVCRALGLKAIHPMAAYFDPTIEGSSPLDECAPGTAVHLHGGHTANASDGGPLDTFRAAGVDPADFAHGAGSVTYDYANDQDAAELWNHDHALGSTRFNPMSGLAAAYLLRDRWDTGEPDNPLGLPANDEYTILGADGDGVVRQAVNPHELPLVLQDRQFNPDGTIAYPTVNTCPPGVTPPPDWCHPLWAPESFGNVSLVNGAAWPNLSVDRGVYRFRIIDGANARFYQLQLINAATGEPANIPAYQIGAEGGLFNAPVALSALPQGKLLIAPGERADLLVDFRSVAPGRYQLLNTAKAPYPNGVNDLRKIMQFTVTATPGTGSIPTTLRGGVDQPPLTPTAQPVSGGSCWTEPAPCRRTMFLNEVLTPAGDPTEVLLNNLDFTAGSDDNHLVMNLGPGAARPKLNTVEEWDIVNTTADAHPIHLHDTQFRVINRQQVDSTRYLAAVNPLLPDAPTVGGSGVQGSFGIIPPPDPTPFLKSHARAPAANERGWKDTVIAYPGEVLRILVPFGGTAVGITSAFSGDAQHQYTGAYVWHCHILEHEENDMMQGYVLTP
jgi:FtsP/CotA-like multicopper oxidase with cupredoxin domain